MFGFTGSQITIGAIGGAVTATAAIAIFGFAAALAVWCVFGVGIYAATALAKHCGWDKQHGTCAKQQ